MTATRILMLGAPGAGKGTQAEKLVARLGVPHISTGDMLRAAVAAETEVGKRAKAVMESGALVSDEIVTAIAEERLAQADTASGFVLDGFPRTAPQAHSLDGILSRLNVKLDACLALTVDVDAVVERLQRRAEIEGRADDNTDSVRRRMDVYEEQTAPLLEHYRSQGLLVEVSGVGEIAEVAASIEARLGSP
ncbi:MAG: adenylate kinase [Myxococcota bacterium]